MGKNSRSSIVYKQTSYLFQYPSKVVTETADAKIKIGVTKNDQFQKHECCHKNYARVPSKSDYSTPNTSMEDFAPDLNSAIEIIKQGVNLERRYVSVY